MIQICSGGRLAVYLGLGTASFIAAQTDDSNFQLQFLNIVADHNRLNWSKTKYDFDRVGVAINFSCEQDMTDLIEELKMAREKLQFLNAQKSQTKKLRLVDDSSQANPA